MTLDAIVYTPDGVERHQTVNVEAVAGAVAGKPWRQAEEAETTGMQALRERFDIHPLAVEDVLDEIEDDIEAVEERVLTSPDPHARGAERRAT